MPFGKGRRKLVWVLGVLFCGLAAIWFSVPLWFPWLFRPLAEQAGAHFRSYTREGYGRFTVSGFAFTNESVALNAGTIRGLVPNVWLWRLATGQRSGVEPFLSVKDWACDLLPGTNVPSSSYTHVQDLAVALSSIQRWVPQASLSRGTVRSGSSVFSVAGATWREGELQAEARVISPMLKEPLEARLTPAGPFRFQVAMPGLALQTTTEIITNRAGFELNSSVNWRSNRLEFQAGFDSYGTLPVTAAVQSVNFRVPGQLLNLPVYGDISGSLSGVWTNNLFALDLAAMGHPAPDQTNLPPVQLELRARGDTNSATIERLNVQTPFLQVNLSNQVTVMFAAPYLRGEGILNLSADLSQQHFFDVKGAVKGSAAVSTGPDNRPKAEVHLRGTDLGLAEIEAQSVELSAHLDWPTSVIDQAELHFEDGSSGTLTGQVDLEKRTVTGGRFQFKGPLARRWLPADYSFRDLSAEGTFSGPLEKPAHTGRIQLSELVTPYLKPINLECQWNGQATAIAQFDLRLMAPEGSLSAGGALTIDFGHADLRLRSLSLVTNQATALELRQPATVTYSNTTGTAGFRLGTSPIDWLGPAGELELEAAVQWPNEGNFRFVLQRFSPDLLSAFAKTNFPHITIQSLDVGGNWTNGPITFTINAAGNGIPSSINAPEGSPEQNKKADKDKDAAERMLATPLMFRLNLQGDGRGIVISNLVVNSSTSDVVNVRGFLPVTITPAATNLLGFDLKEQLKVNAEVRPEAFFWEHLVDLTGMRLGEPRLDLALNGTWNEPVGRIVFAAQTIELKQSGTNQLALENLRMDLSLNGETTRLTEGRLLVQGQAMSVEGELPLGKAWWTALTQKKIPDWTQARGRIRIQEAKVAAFSRLFPELLAPQGDLNLDLELLPGYNFKGILVLRGARTRPLGNTAPIRNINVTLRFHERQMELENATANLGGATLKLTGAVDLRGTNWLAGGELPPFHFMVAGTNVPLARAPEYVIRSDLDLTIVKTNEAPPLVFGTAHLRDSFFLSDLSGLVPSKVETPESRPPYLSIDNPTLADWRLAVTVEGLRWLRVRTSLFNGLVSANLHLQGTLKDPIALGGVTVDSGLVRFPFANFQVQQGLVTLTSQDPYHPQLLVRAVSKQFGYDLRMEVSGAVDSPLIQFTSNPPLSSEQILLMITAGQLPQGAYTLSPQQRAQTVALFLGKDLLSKLGFGDQSQERLTISSGQEISEQGRPTYSVEYKITDRWSVVGEYDRFGDFNAGLKWRVYSK